MSMAERDRTEDWLLPESARPPTLAELEARIEEATAIARASEAAAAAVGAAAIDAAEQARRAAELAERASAAMLDRPLPESVKAVVAAPDTVPAAVGATAAVEGNGIPSSEFADWPDAEVGPVAEDAEDADDGLEDFYARADRLAERLERLRERGIG